MSFVVCLAVTCILLVICGAGASLGYYYSIEEQITTSVPIITVATARTTTKPHPTYCNFQLYQFQDTEKWFLINLEGNIGILYTCNDGRISSLRGPIKTEVIHAYDKFLKVNVTEMTYFTNFHETDWITHPLEVIPLRSHNMRLQDELVKQNGQIQALLKNLASQNHETKEQIVLRMKGTRLIIANQSEDEPIRRTVIERLVAENYAAGLTTSPIETGAAYELNENEKNLTTRIFSEIQENRTTIRFQPLLSSTESDDSKFTTSTLGDEYNEVEDHLPGSKSADVQLIRRSVQTNHTNITTNNNIL